MRPRPYWRCTCGSEPCACAWVIEVEQGPVGLDWLIGMRYVAMTMHPSAQSVMNYIDYGYTSAGVVRKARRRVPVGVPVELVEIVYV